MSGHADSGAGGARQLSHVTDEMKGLLEQQMKIRKWLTEVHSKIYTLEESYLEETPLGNIVRGWEIDGKPLPLKFKGQEEKERLFSCSSYHPPPERKTTHDVQPDAVGEKRSHHAASGLNGRSSDGPKNKKVRKSHSKKGADLYEEWEQQADY